MKPEIDLSIIIPVYKVEEYIERCLDSIYNQACNDLQFEVITVNDGSPDNSLYIIKKYQQYHPDLILINSDNQGAGSARNKGLDRAQGEFIWFIDGDDFIEPNAFQFIYKNAILKHQQIGFNYNYFDKIKSPANPHLKMYPFSKTFEGLDYTFSNSDWYLWTCILKREYIENNNIRFTEDIKNIEDFEFMIRVFLLNKNMTFFNVRLYNYNIMNNQSTSRNKSRENLVKLAADSFRVHKNLNFISRNETNISLKYWESFSIIGFFYSLLLYYDNKDFIIYLEKYKENNLIPIKIVNMLPLKFKLFGVILNNAPTILILLKRLI